MGDMQVQDVFWEVWDKMLIEDLEGSRKGNGLDSCLRQGDNPEKES